MPEYRAEMPGNKTARVEGAPTTKHARTAYLDYLSRNKHISWKDRGEARRMIDITQWQDWMEPDVVLDYDMVTKDEELGIPEGIAMEYEGDMFEDEEVAPVDTAREFYPPPTRGEKTITMGRPAPRVPAEHPPMDLEEEEVIEAPRVKPRRGLRDKPARELFGGSKIEGLSRSESAHLAGMGTDRFDVIHSNVGDVSRRSGGV